MLPSIKDNKSSYFLFSLNLSDSSVLCGNFYGKDQYVSELWKILEKEGSKIVIAKDTGLPRDDFLRINSGNFDNTTHYFSFNFWCILNISLNKRKII
jgi:hypothetical protein